MALCLFSQTETARGLGPFLRENWLLLLPVVLGFAAIYPLLPQARRSRPVWAGALAVLALVLGGAILVHTDAYPVESLLFYCFAGGAIGAGVMMITQKNPVHAALSFALVVLSSCGLFLLQAAPFLMAATIIVYAGAIVVTFLFVIMLAQQEGPSSADQRTREPFLASLAGCILLGSLVCILHKNYDRGEHTKGIDELKQLADIARELRAVGGMKDARDIMRVLGDPRDLEPDQLECPLIKKLKRHYPASELVREEGANFQLHWVKMDVPKLKVSAGKLLGAIQVPGSLALHNVPAKSNMPGHPTPGHLPASNVAAIGRTLFTDYLIPVEMAAVLLLVATIGAIVIAGRRSEALR